MNSNLCCRFPFHLSLTRPGVSSIRDTVKVHTYWYSKNKKISSTVKMSRRKYHWDDQWWGSKMMSRSLGTKNKWREYWEGFLSINYRRMCSRKVRSVWGNDSKRSIEWEDKYSMFWRIVHKQELFTSRFKESLLKLWNF